METLEISSFISKYGREIVLMLAAVLAIRVIKMLLRQRSRRKAFLKEQAQANQLLRDEALNNEILNPERRPGDVVEQKHAYKVEFAEKPGNLPGGSRSGSGAAGGLFSAEKRDAGSAAGALLKITEYSSLSKRSYMFKNNETVRIGNQYGNTTILAGNPGDSILYFEILPFQNHFYIRSGGSEKVVVTRKGSRRVLGDRELLLCEGDRVSVGGKAYEISFFRQ